MRLIAFHLPQFHPIPENDRWWGKGFTEWTNVSRAVPQFPGHAQPRLPADLGFYDLRLPEARQAQAELAAAYGIHGFCYHHYWFGGRRVLERPFEDVLASGQPDFPFCVQWANENWTRRWDGSEDHVLLRQEYSDEHDIRFLEDLAPALRDDRYIRVNGKPLIIVYYTAALPDPRRSTAIWRHGARALGLGDLYLVCAETHTRFEELPDPRGLGFDAAVEFPPHGVHFANRRDDVLPPDAPFRGHLLDYPVMALSSLARPDPGYPLLRTLIPDWDNSPRRRERGTVFRGANPATYEAWLAGLLDWTRRHRAGDEQLVFVNAWNEWAEGAYLEPDARWGRGYLEATARALSQPYAPTEAHAIWTEPDPPPPESPPPPPPPPEPPPPEPPPPPPPPATEWIPHARIAQIPLRTVVAARLIDERPRLRRTRKAAFRMLQAMRGAVQRLRGRNGAP